MGRGLVHSCLSGDVARLHQALAQGDNLNKYNGRPLRTAVSQGHVDAVRALLEAGARVDVCDTYIPSEVVRGARCKDRLGGATLLHLCASAPHLGPIVTLLLKHGANASVCTSGSLKNTPLHLAAEHGCAAVVKALLEGGAQPNVRNAEGHSPLHRAIAVKQNETIDVLLDNGAEVNFATARGNTPLHIVCETELGKAFDRTLATRLLSYGANPALRNNDGNTPLECITRLGPHREAFRQLVATTPRRSAAAAAPAGAAATAMSAARAQAETEAARATAEAARVRAQAEAEAARAQADAARARAAAEAAPLRAALENAPPAHWEDEDEEAEEYEEAEEDASMSDLEDLPAWSDPAERAGDLAQISDNSELLRDLMLDDAELEHDRDITPLAMALSTNTNLVSLHARRTGLTSASGALLLSGLATHPRIDDINLSGNEDALDSPACSEALSRLLRSSVSLRHLDISDTGCARSQHGVAYLQCQLQLRGQGGGKGDG